MLAERGAFLLLSNVHERQKGRNLREFFEQTGLTGGSGDTVHIFPVLESAIEWVEERLIAEVKAPVDEEVLLQLQEMELFQGHKDETLVDLEERMEQRSFKAGEAIYSIGDQGHAIYLIRRGEVRITAPIVGSRQLHHVATIGRGDFLVVWPFSMVITAVIMPLPIRILISIC